jgi:hypothetical protein
MSRAARTSSVLRWLAVNQPTIFLQTSMTTARKRKPASQW